MESEYRSGSGPSVGGGVPRESPPRHLGGSFGQGATARTREEVLPVRGAEDSHATSLGRTRFAEKVVHHSVGASARHPTKLAAYGGWGLKGVNGSPALDDLTLNDEKINSLKRRISIVENILAEIPTYDPRRGDLVENLTEMIKQKCLIKIDIDSAGIPPMHTGKIKNIAGIPSMQNFKNQKIAGIPPMQTFQNYNAAWIPPMQTFDENEAGIPPMQSYNLN